MTRSSAAGRDLFKGMTRKKDKDPKKAAPPAILVGEHGRYQIKSGRLAGEYVARAFPKPPTKARGLIAEATGATEEAAIAALHEAIDARENRRTHERRTDTHTGVAVPSTEEYGEAIRQIALSQPQRAMLTALSLAGEEGLDDGPHGQVGRLTKSQTSANRSFAGAGLSDRRLSVARPDNGRWVAHSGRHIAPWLQGAKRQATKGTGNWVLYAELREALRASS